jgi:hypothetical protein
MPSPPSVLIGGVPGEFPDIPDGERPEPPDGDQPERQWVVERQPHTSDGWDLLNQHWTVQLVPAVQGSLVDILQTVPQLPEFGGADVRLPNLGGMSAQDIGQISTH